MVEDGRGRAYAYGRNLSGRKVPCELRDRGNAVALKANGQFVCNEEC